MVPPLRPDELEEVVDSAAWFVVLSCAVEVVALTSGGIVWEKMFSRLGSSQPPRAVLSVALSVELVAIYKLSKIE